MEGSPSYQRTLGTRISVLLPSRSSTLVLSFELWFEEQAVAHRFWAGDKFPSYRGAVLNHDAPKRMVSLLNPSPRARPDPRLNVVGVRKARASHTVRLTRMFPVGWFL